MQGGLSGDSLKQLHLLTVVLVWEQAWGENLQKHISGLACMQTLKSQVQNHNMQMINHMSNTS